MGIRYRWAAPMKPGDSSRLIRNTPTCGRHDPSNLDAQMRAGNILLAAGEFQQARTRQNSP